LLSTPLGLNIVAHFKVQKRTITQCVSSICVANAR
jgi:hypothetical protein